MKFQQIKTIESVSNKQKKFIHFEILRNAGMRSSTAEVQCTDTHTRPPDSRQ